MYSFVEQIKKKTEILEVIQLVITKSSIFFRFLKIPDLWIEILKYNVDYEERGLFLTL